MSSRRMVGEAAERAAPIAWRLQEEAARKAAEPVEQTAVAVAQVERQAYEKGLADARRQCEEKHRQEWERLGHALEQLAALKPRLRRETEAAVVRLAVTVARRILRREVSVDPGAIEGIVKAALESVSLGEITRVRTAPASRTVLEATLARIGPSVRIEVEADPALEAGNLQVDTTRGTLDASMEGQLAEIERGFADLLGVGR